MSYRGILQRIIPSKLHTDIRLSKFFNTNILAWMSLRKTLRSTTLRFVSLDLLRKSLSESPISFADKSARCFPIHPSFFSAFSRLSPRPISNSQLHVLPHFHLCPIYLVVFKGVYFIRMGYLILRGASRLDAFSVYPFRTWLPGHGFGKPTGPPAVRPSRSSRTKDSSSQISCAHAG